MHISSLVFVFVFMLVCMILFREIPLFYYRIHPNKYSRTNTQKHDYVIVVHTQSKQESKMNERVN